MYKSNQNAMLNDQGAETKLSIYSGGKRKHFLGKLP